VGLDRENAQKIGLEKTYDTLLKGTTGRRLVRYIAGGASIPVDDEQIEPENGKDIVTTLDVFIQEVTENALMKMMVSNEAVHGCAIVMEVKTGKVKAIANLGRRQDGSYSEDYNYAISPSEPGSTFKLATIMSLLEDKKITLNSVVNLNGGSWLINGETVFDSEQHGKFNVTVKDAFALSSNVGMAKLVIANYGNSPKRFIQQLHNMRLDTLTGIDITGERNAVIPKPGTKNWSSISLPWMSFGYNIEVTPLQTATFYNAVANNGTMMKPYLLNAVKDEGEVISVNEPKVLVDRICSDATIQQLKICLEAVCTYGTAKELFKNSTYKVAGKTGTALVADRNRGYKDEIYQTSFAGYFPANDPQYTIVVVIKNKPKAVTHYGATVAGPVFKEIADRLYTNYVRQINYTINNKKIDSTGAFNYTGARQDIKHLTTNLKLGYKDVGTTTDEWLEVNINKGAVGFLAKPIDVKTMPQLRGMGLKDVVVLCENIGLKVSAKGKGRVATQSILPGQSYAKGQILNIELN
jgi:cell division protein FtsI (penicillin-binding protein 3)